MTHESRWFTYILCIYYVYIYTHIISWPWPPWLGEITRHSSTGSLFACWMRQSINWIIFRHIYQRATSFCGWFPDDFVNWFLDFVAGNRMTWNWADRCEAAKLVWNQLVSLLHHASCVDFLLAVPLNFCCFQHDFCSPAIQLGKGRIHFYRWFHRPCLHDL